MNRDEFLKLERDRLDHMAWLLSKAPYAKREELTETLDPLTSKEYFDVMAWAFNQATSYTPAFSMQWVDQLLVEVTLDKHDLKL